MLRACGCNGLCGFLVCLQRFGSLLFCGAEKISIPPPRLDAPSSPHNSAHLCRHVSCSFSCCPIVPNGDNSGAAHQSESSSIHPSSFIYTVDPESCPASDTPLHHHRVSLESSMRLLHAHLVTKIATCICERSKLCGVRGQLGCCVRA